MAELDRWIEGLDRPDVADALARQREHRKGTWFGSTQRKGKVQEPPFMDPLQIYGGKK